MQNQGQVDHIFLRIKDVLLIGASLVAIATWYLGIADLPKLVESHEQRLVKIEAAIVKNDLVVSGIQKDLNYLTNGVDEIKQILKEVYKNRPQGG